MPSTPSVHHLVKESTHAVRIGTVEQGGIRRHPEARWKRLRGYLRWLCRIRLPADGEVVVLTLPIQMHGEGKIFAGLEEVRSFLSATGRWCTDRYIFSAQPALQQSRLSVDAAGVLRQGWTPLESPHSSTARKHSSGVNCFFKMCAGYWILPQPAHARLQRNNGSSIRTKG